jgi:HSP20 family protein
VGNARRRRNPFRGLVDHMSEMSRMREYAEGGAQETQRRTHASAWVPTTDIFAQGDDLVIRCELAGVEREDIDIELIGDTLTITGERRSELSEEVHFYTRERSFGHFRRSMNLPEGIEDDDLGASFKDGMLQVTVRGAAAAAPEPRRIEIDDESG